MQPWGTSEEAAARRMGKLRKQRKRRRRKKTYSNLGLGLGLGPKGLGLGQIPRDNFKYNYLLSHDYCSLMVGFHIEKMNIYYFSQK
jgi:hypothetical protein